MKKLRLFDSLKLVLATVACMFAIMPAHADTTINSVIAYGKTEQSATPTPTAPVPIMTNNGVLKASANLLNPATVPDENKYVAKDGSVMAPDSSGTFRHSDFIPVQGGETYYFGITPFAAITAGLAWYSSETGGRVGGISGKELRQANMLATAPAGAKYMRFSWRIDNGYDTNWRNSVYVCKQGAMSSFHAFGSVYADGLTETIRDSAGHTATAQMLLGLNDTYRDEQNINTGAITRKVGVKVLDGTENWVVAAGTDNAYLQASELPGVKTNSPVLCSHLINSSAGTLRIQLYGVLRVYGIGTGWADKANFQSWLAEQYAAGTPVIVVYPLAESAQTTESVATQSLTTAPVRQTAGSILGMPIEVVFGDGTREWVSEIITIATTRYNEEQFAPVKTDLSAAVNAVEYVVSNTMSQAQAIDQIANEKQTRPEEGCTAKYCLLVEDEDGTPHWYPIAGANGVEYVLPAGYTELQYIRLANGAFIITNIYPNQDTEFIVDFQHEQDALKWLFGTRSYPAGASNGQNPINKFALQVFSTSNGSVWMQFDNTTNLEYGTNTVASDATSRLARHQCGIKNQRVWCDGNFISWNSSDGPTNISNFTATNPLVIGGVQISTGYSSSATFIGKIYSATDLVPCRRDSDSAVGLCRTSTGDFFGNSAGVGTITAGPDA